MSLRTVSVMVLGPLIVAVGAVLVLTPKDVLRQPVVAATTSAPGTVLLPPEAPLSQPEPPQRAAVISLSDLAPAPEPEAVHEEASLPEPDPVLSADRRWIAASGGLNLRGGPGVDNRLIVSLPYGTPVEVIETSGTWARVEAGDYSGWLSANFLTADKPSSGT